jgi:hypothetical protein
MLGGLGRLGKARDKMKGGCSGLVRLGTRSALHREHAQEDDEN